MSIENDGGPAFPNAVDFTLDGPVPRFERGMTLRQWYAGQALAGILSENSQVSDLLLATFGGPGLNRSDVAARAAYHFADAMLAAEKISTGQ